MCCVLFEERYININHRTCIVCRAASKAVSKFGFLLEKEDSEKPCQCERERERERVEIFIRT